METSLLYNQDLWVAAVEILKREIQAVEGRQISGADEEVTDLQSIMKFMKLSSRALDGGVGITGIKLSDEERKQADIAYQEYKEHRHSPATVSGAAIGHGARTILKAMVRAHS